MATFEYAHLYQWPNVWNKHHFALLTTAKSWKVLDTQDSELVLYDELGADGWLLGERRDGVAIPQHVRPVIFQRLAALGIDLKDPQVPHNVTGSSYRFLRRQTS